MLIKNSARVIIVIINGKINKRLPLIASFFSHRSKYSNKSEHVVIIYLLKKSCIWLKPSSIIAYLSHHSKPNNKSNHTVII